MLILLSISCVQISKAQFSYEITNYNSVNTPTFSGNNFKCVWIGKGGVIWAGTQYQGLYRYDRQTELWSKSGQLTNVFINQIQSDKDGGIWVAQSGTSGQSGGGSNLTGGINYFPEPSDLNSAFYNDVNNYLPSRNVRSIYYDTVNTPANPANKMIWSTQATFITSSSTKAGGIVNSFQPGFFSSSFTKITKGLQVSPNTNTVSSGTPSCYAVAGNKDEILVGAETNYLIAAGSTSQILRYDAVTGAFLGGFDSKGEFDNSRLNYNYGPFKYINNNTDGTSSAGVLPVGFRTTAMYVDKENRVWIGLRNGGVIVKVGSTWKAVNMPTIFPVGTLVNFNAISADEYGYVYIGTSNGLVVFNNGGDVTDVNSYTRLTTTDGLGNPTGLASNNITGAVYDYGSGRMILTSDAGVIFLKYKYKVAIEMLWDYSCPERNGRPIGTVADGVARIYLKIKKADITRPDIKSVEVSLKDYSAAAANIRGKLKKATIIDKYSEEASPLPIGTGTQTLVTIANTDQRPGATGDFWFWYVAPDDFSNDATSAEATISKRYDILKVKVTYVDNSEDIIDFKVAIVRPPTLFVHGLNSGPYTWDNLNHDNFGTQIPFVKSTLFAYKYALKMDPGGLFQKNGNQLLAGDIDGYEGYGKLNTLQGNIDAVREMKFACNQVDYVCHSMGGIMIRTAIGYSPEKFYTGTNSTYKYKNYQKGFTHKIITINTPHNSSPVADLVDQFIPLVNDNNALAALNTGYYIEKINSFVQAVGQPTIYTNHITGTTYPYYNSFKSSDAVYNLQVTDARGGLNMLETKAKFHMIVGDLDWAGHIIRPPSISSGNQSFDNGFIEGIGKICSKIIEAIYANLSDASIFDQTKFQQNKVFFLNLLALPYEYKVGGLLNWASERKNYPDYLKDGDLVVPLKSQTAQQLLTSPFVTVFKNTDGDGKDFPGINACHVYILGRNDVGNKVLELLNTRLTSNLFGDVIPKDIDPEPDLLLRPANNSGVNNRPAASPIIKTFYDTTKVRIDAPLYGATLLADSTFAIKFRVKDTTRLAYIAIAFQTSDSTRINKIRSQQTINFKVDPATMANNKIWVKAVYDNSSNNGVDYFIDTISIAVNNLAPLQGFKVKQYIEQIQVGEPFVPEVFLKYNNNWITIPNTDPNINVNIDSVNVVGIDPVLKTFTATKQGSATANFTYKGFSDSILFKTYLPYNLICINRSIASGSFKNPAIWSKGLVPGICDSVVIGSGHVVTVDTSLLINALRVNSGGTFTINRGIDTLQIGEPTQRFSIADIYGVLNISNGGVSINGKIKMNSSSSFNMSGGKLTLDGNKGIKELSIDDGQALFEAAPAMTGFNFTNGVLQINNPPFGAASQAISCAYDFGNNSTLVLGINTSTIASKNVNGFGGLAFPNKIGKLIINTGTKNGNRQFINKKALTVKGNAEVRTGSAIILQAPLNVTQ